MITQTNILNKHLKQQKGKVSLPDFEINFAKFSLLFISFEETIFKATRTKNWQKRIKVFEKRLGRKNTLCIVVWSLRGNEWTQSVDVEWGCLHDNHDIRNSAWIFTPCWLATVNVRYFFFYPTEILKTTFSVKNNFLGKNDIMIFEVHIEIKTYNVLLRNEIKL